MSRNNITLEACDGKLVIDEEAYICQSSGVLQDMIKTFGKDVVRREGIPRLPIRAATLSMILWWCKYHANNKLRTKGGFYTNFDEGQRIQKWDTEFMRVEADTLFDILRAANYLDISDLFDTGCKKAADMVRAGSLGALSGLPNDIQIEIGQHLPPYAFLDAAAAGIVPGTAAQIKQAKQWTSLIKNDEWFLAALAFGANPMLVAKDFDAPRYLVLADLDKTGQLKHGLRAEKTILNSLQPGDWNNASGEFTVKDGTVYNIWNAEFGHYSPVSNFRQRLVKSREDGKLEVSVMYLKSPKVHRLVCSNFCEDSRRMVVRTTHIHPHYPCLVDHLIVEAEERPSILEDPNIMVRMGGASEFNGTSVVASS
ncbi:hypothetical protein J7T55_002188 [Diaporthe amygdali]|uniref:uncharacterized protein n=1 Tax=Phomopsis amygdali TaxID=1214568 RepID=UPI0022FE2696|nr:uncharacterized protein J7T55_002188 [Diaporthe amygdali]KAJ0103769.1 hypothetical protein J7T55_002188 [Diaporthe amygdali]